MDFAVPSVPSARKTDLSEARIKLAYLWRHGNLPNLRFPEKFTEHVQFSKLHDRDFTMPLLADKVAVKDVVAERIGCEWVIPTLWHGEILPQKAEWPAPFVLKARHGCNQSIFVHTDKVNWNAIRRKSARWVGKAYGGWLDEWLYAHIPRGLLTEPFIGEGRRLPIDYKFYVFGGRVEYVQVHLDRGGRHRWILLDRDWRRVSAQSSDVDPVPPVNLARMIEAAEELGREFDFVRVDLYEAGGNPLFGEMTFYPGSGLDPFDPVSLDIVIGKHWTRAKSGNLNSTQQGLTFLPASS